MASVIQDLNELILSDEEYEDQADISSDDDDDLIVESSDVDTDLSEDEPSDEDEEERIRLPHRRPHRTSQADLTADSDRSGDESDVSNSLDTSLAASQRRRFTRHISSSETEQDLRLLYPASLQPGHETYLDLGHERQILEEFASLGVLIDETSDQDSFQFEELYNVSIYRSINHPNGLHGQLEALHTVASDLRSGIYYLDGDLRRGEESRRLVGVLIHPEQVQIGALEYPRKHTTKADIWVQTVAGKTADDTWYKLKTPSAEYTKLYEQSLWLADLVKHVSDFCDVRATNGQLTSLSDFAELFSKQLQGWHGHDGDFQLWFTACGRPTDFRKHVLRNAQSLWDNLHSLDDHDLDDGPIEQPLWSEIGVISEAHQGQWLDPDDEKTVVTDGVRQSFLKCFPRWGRHELDLLEAVPYAQNVAAIREIRLKALKFPDNLGPARSQTFCRIDEDGDIPKTSLFMEQAALTKCHTTLSSDEMVGKIIVVRRTSKKGQDSGYDYAWASALTSHGGKIKVIWLLQPSMTMCGSKADDGTFYPVGTELFFDQDRCSCSDVVLTINIYGVFDATVMGVVYGTRPELFVRQAYSEKEQTIVLATEDNIECKYHRKQKKKQRAVYDAPCVDETPEKLRTLSLFAGCGLLDYSLVDSGSFEIVQAIDLDNTAIKSHKLNARSTDCEYRVESVDRHLKLILMGRLPITNVHSLVAGCPCQGFSKLNKFKHKRRGQKNCSILAGTVASIEVHLPLFVIIENVPAMDSANPKKGRGNACAQAICHLVALGYQIRKMVVPAQAYGACTRRERLFLIAAAPQVVLPDMPTITHGDDSLDLEQEIRVCDALEDLEPIDEHIAVNPRRPDHIPILRLKSRRHDTVSLRNIVQRIPTSPPGQNLSMSYKRLTGEQKKWFKTLSKSQRGTHSTCLRRVDAQRPFQTIVTSASPLDGHGSGRIVHPNEHRLLSLEEFRRAQGTPDSFLMAGSLRDQLHQQGNGVPWQLGRAIGTSVDDAWKRSYWDVADLKQLGAEYDASQQATTHNLATSESPHTCGKQLQQELEKTLDDNNESGADNLMGDTIVFCPSPPMSPKANEAATVIDLRDIKSAPIVINPLKAESAGGSVPKGPMLNEEDRKHKRSQSASPTPAGRRRSSAMSTTTPDNTSETSLRTVLEDVVEISEHEFFDFKPDGGVKFERSHRETYTRKYARSHRQPNIVVEVPIRKKRPAPVKEEAEDEDIIYVKTQPASTELSRSVTPRPAKRARVGRSTSIE